MSKHTEGPWVALENCGDWSVYGPDGEPVAAFIRVYPDCAFGIDKDDAHLIASAPDLYEAIQALIPALMSKSAMMDKSDWAAVKSANEALVKARGEE